jgi:uncharacterized protein YbjT (DUF2867 family)
MTSEVLVLGATGNTGSTIVEALKGHNDVKVRPASRSSTPRFDWFDAASHRGVLDGVARLYLVAPVGETDPIAVVGPFLEEAAHSGVRRVVMLSSSAVASGDPGLGTVDAMVRKIFHEWAILRPSWFMQNFVRRHPIGDSIRESGEFITATGDGRLPFIDARDIGRCAATLLTTSQAENREHMLTGPQALSYDDAAEIMSTVTSSPVRHRAVDTPRYVRFLVHAGYSAEFAAGLAALDEQIRDGKQSQVTDTVQRLTGRPPSSFEQFLHAYSAARS